VDSFSLLPEVGIFNRIYPLGEDFVFDLLPVPYSIYEIVRVETLGLLDRNPVASPGVWREPGHDLALLHSGVLEDGPTAGLEMDEMPDPHTVAPPPVLSLYHLRREPQPGRSWAERPLGMLLDVIRFSLDPPGERWSTWMP
jgi:hypothetical protein